MFGLRRVQARDVGVDRVDGLAVAPDQWITPVIDVLPIGFSFALRWAQKAHEKTFFEGRG